MKKLAKEIAIVAIVGAIIDIVIDTIVMWLCSKFGVDLGIVLYRYWGQDVSLGGTLRLIILILSFLVTGCLVSPA